MEKYEKEFIEKTGVKLIIGKGGMGPKTTEGCVQFGAVHAVFPGGCAVLAAQCVEEVENVEWLDLGMPEAMWVMAVKEFGPLIVSIDTKGMNLFERNRHLFDERKAPIIEEICKHVDYLHGPKG
jgi:L(+)-tartrate dehydratase beta subunit